MPSPRRTRAGVAASLLVSLYWVRRPLCVVLGAFGVVLLAGLAGLRGTVTGSMPRGLYLARPFHPPARPGDTVSLCLPDALARWMHARRYLAAGPFCGNGAQRLTKAVLARGGDTVTLTPRGMIYRGRLLPNTAPLARDGRGRALPRLAPGRYVVPPGHLWLFSTHSPRTIDSRYFGPVPESRVRALWRPLWTEDHTAPPAVCRVRRQSARRPPLRATCPRASGGLFGSGGDSQPSSDGASGNPAQFTPPPHIQHNLRVSASASNFYWN
jgi:conjugative transfer signal peptidase TraF